MEASASHRMQQWRIDETVADAVEGQDRDGEETCAFELVHRWVSPVTEVVVTHDEARLVTINHDHNVRLFDALQEGDVRRTGSRMDTDDAPQDDFVIVLCETNAITSLCLSADSRFVLLNLVSSKITLWDLTTHTRVRSFEGLLLGRYIIRASFGGAREQYVSSGSEGT